MSYIEGKSREQRILFPEVPFVGIHFVCAGSAR